MHIKLTKLPDLIWMLITIDLSVFACLLEHKTPALHKAEFSADTTGAIFSRVNGDSRHGWLETVGRVFSYQAVVCTSFILMREFNGSYLRKGTSILFVQWALVVYSQKTSQKVFVWKEQGKQTPCVYRCHMGSRKGIRGTWKPLLTGLRWEVGPCVKEQSDACRSPAVLLPQLNF